MEGLGPVCQLIFLTAKYKRRYTENYLYKKRKIPLSIDQKYYLLLECINFIHIEIEKLLEFSCLTILEAISKKIPHFWSYPLILSSHLPSNLSKLVNTFCYGEKGIMYIYLFFKKYITSVYSFYEANSSLIQFLPMFPFYTPRFQGL